MTATEDRKHCPHCPETFHDSSGVRRHMRRKHADAVPDAMAPRHTAEDVKRAVAQLQQELTAAAPEISRVMNEAFPDRRPGIEIEPDPAGITQGDREFVAVNAATGEPLTPENIGRLLGIPEPVRASELNDGDTVLWLGEKRTIETIRPVDTGQLMLRFSPTHHIYLSRRTIVRRMPK